jgi:hypothetical protein
LVIQDIGDLDIFSWFARDFIFGSEACVGKHDFLNEIS